MAAPGQRAGSSCAGARGQGLHGRLVRLCSHQQGYFGDSCSELLLLSSDRTSGEPLPLYCPETGGKGQGSCLLLNKRAHSHSHHIALYLQNRVDISEWRAEALIFPFAGGGAPARPPVSNPP